MQVTTSIDIEILMPPGYLIGPVAGFHIKGNINKDGEKIYHIPNSRCYRSTKIDIENGERWFRTEEEAFSFGWRSPRR